MRDPLSPAAPWHRAVGARAAPVTISGLVIALLLSGAPAMPIPESTTSTPAPPPAASSPGEAAPNAELVTAELIVTSRRPMAGDPVEKLNVQSFALTQSIDKAVIGPAAHAFERTVPKPIRSGLINFLSNLHEPVVFVNFLLQLKPGKALRTVARFAINTTVGAAGLMDIAKRHPFDLPHRRNGFADTMGYYGVKPGAYLYLPLIGSTTVRDLAGDSLDRLLVPLSAGKPFNQASFTVPAGVGKTLDKRAEFDEQLLRIRASADPYAAARDIYLKRRQAEIDGLRATPDGVSEYATSR